MVKVTGGENLVEKLQHFSSQIAKAGTVKVGFFATATYPDGTPVAMVAAIQEYGAPRARIPPRPFFRTMIREKKDEWGPAIAGLLVDNDYDTKVVLEQTGAAIAAQLQDSISDIMEPALSPVTVMLRHMRSQNQNLVVTGKTVGEAARRVAAGESSGGASTKPLIDTGTMRRYVSFQVKT